jgi:hypothetical protein
MIQKQVRSPHFLAIMGTGSARGSHPCARALRRCPYLAHKEKKDYKDKIEESKHGNYLVAQGDGSKYDSKKHGLLKSYSIKYEYLSMFRKISGFKKKEQELSVSEQLGTVHE